MNQESTSFLGVLADIATKQLERENFSISRNGEHHLRPSGEFSTDPEDTEVKIKNHLLQNLFGIQKEKLQMARDMLTSLSVVPPPNSSSQTAGPPLQPRRATSRVYGERDMELYLGLASKKYFAKHSTSSDEKMCSAPVSNQRSEQPSPDSGVCSAPSPVGSDRLVIAEHEEEDQGCEGHDNGGDTVCLYLPGPPHTNRVVLLRTSGRPNEPIGVVRAPHPTSAPTPFQVAKPSDARWWIQDHNYALLPSQTQETFPQPYSEVVKVTTDSDDCSNANLFKNHNGDDICCGYVDNRDSSVQKMPSHKKGQSLHSSVPNNGGSQSTRRPRSVSGVAAVSEPTYVKIAPNNIKPKLPSLNGDGMISLEHDNFAPVSNAKVNVVKKATPHDGENSDEKNLALKYIREIRLASTRSNHCVEGGPEIVPEMSPSRPLSQYLSPTQDVQIASTAQSEVKKENFPQGYQNCLVEEKEENVEQGDERIEDLPSLNPESSKKKKRVLSCALCPQKIFTASASLLNHYRSHAGIKPYICSDCGSSFTRQHSLNYHMLIHQNASRFSCETCGRRFRHPSHFKEHLRKHTGETPYTCSQCSTSFKTRNTYKRHLKARHYMLLTVDGIRNMTPQEILSMENATTDPPVPSISSASTSVIPITTSTPSNTPPH